MSDIYRSARQISAMIESCLALARQRQADSRAYRRCFVFTLFGRRHKWQLDMMPDGGAAIRQLEPVVIERMFRGNAKEVDRIVGRGRERGRNN